MQRYELVGRRVNGYAQSNVEEHSMGTYVKYVDVVDSISALNSIKAFDLHSIESLKRSSQHQLEVIERLLIKSNDLEAEVKKQYPKGKLEGIRLLSNYVDTSYSQLVEDMIKQTEDQI